MARWLKRGAESEELAETDRRVRAAVEDMLTDIRNRGDAAVRDLSRKFDSWERTDYRLTKAEISACLSDLSQENLDDIRFAQALVAQFRREATRLLDRSRSRDVARRRAWSQECAG